MSAEVRPVVRRAGTDADGPQLASRLVRWLEDGVRPDDLFADDLFTDFSLPQWRVQGTSAEDGFRMRETSHPATGTVRVERLAPTDAGFLLQFEERWVAEGQHWYCREMIHACVDDGRISRMDVYCTGDWDEALQRRHALEVRLARP